MIEGISDPRVKKKLSLKNSNDDSEIVAVPSEG